MDQRKIEHLIVLMLENRAFDHLLGYLEYPAEAGFDGVRGKEAEYPNSLPDGSIAVPSNTADYYTLPGPNHSHDSVMRQLLGDNPRAYPYSITNNGFAADYETVNHGHGSEALDCFAPDLLPVLSTLAKQFAVCDRWFCSVPGATWPNRNFAHAATSDGEVNIVTREYYNKTVFEQLSEANRDWAIYYCGFPAQTMAFVHTWDPGGVNWLQRFKPVQNLYRAIRYDRLPQYAFIEPDMLGLAANSQHPGMGGRENFKAGERLIWSVYSALQANPRVFEKTLLLVTYDEHGGFFDHCAPPQGPEWSVPQVYHEPDSDYTFSFDLLGLRVPSVIVSPWIAPGTVDHTLYEHASIPATARKIARADLPPLTPRDARANTFDRVLNLDAPRADLPQIAEPFVDETLRPPHPTVELQESLAYILKQLIWERMASQPEEYAQQVVHHSVAHHSATHQSRTKMVSHVILPSLVHQVVMNDIAPSLSPKAQEKLSGFQPIEAVEELPGKAREEIARLLPVHPEAAGLRLALANIHERITSLLEDTKLTDEAMIFADKVMRLLFEGHHLLLRTAAGESLEDPGEPAIKEALDALYASPDPQALIWLADYLDRWLSVERNGRITFNDQQPAGDYVLENASPETALEKIGLFTSGSFDRLRHGMKKQSSPALARS